MSEIKINHLTFGYDHPLLFEEVSFQLDTDWKLGFIGRNGKGKTTFLKLLLKEYEYKGQIQTDKTFDYFPFEVKNKDQNTIDIIQEITSGIELWKIKKELNLMQVEEGILYRPFSTLSNGEQTKVLLATLFSKENNFLLLDEPTNHLDIIAKETIKQYLKQKKGFILVSHDRDTLDNCIDHVLIINNTNIEVQKGNYSCWKENKERQDNYETQQNEKLKQDIARLGKAARRASDWSEVIEKSKIGAADKGYVGHQAAKMMKRSKIIEKRQQEEIEQKSTLLKNIDKADTLTIKPLQHSKNSIITASGLSVFYGEKKIISNLDFVMKQGDRIAITGKNGSGKSTILKLILQQNINYTGNIHIANDLKISYVQQDTSNLKGSLRQMAKETHIDEGIFKAMLNKLGFSSQDLEKNIEELSQGQKKKVLLARSITESAHLYIWDEPLNYIDVLSREQIEEAILKYQPTMILVDHDKAFIHNVSTKIIEL